MASFAEKLYDSTTERLFLAYYALPSDVVNANLWGVSSSTIAQNIRSFVGKPAVLKRKDHNNPKDTVQQGNFVHPYSPNHAASLKDQLEHQNIYTVGKILDVKLNPAKGYKFEIEITDPLVKEALRNNNDREAPQYVSPLITETGPNPDDRNIMHWAGVHVAFVDRPAFGFERMKPAAICSGSMEECTVVLHNASESNCGFCPKDAMLELCSYSSQFSQNEHDSSLKLMSSSERTAQPVQNYTTTTLSGTAPTTTTSMAAPPVITTTNTSPSPMPAVITASEQGSKIEGDKTDVSKNVKHETEGSEPSTQAKDPDTPTNANANANLPKSYEEALEALKQRDAEIVKLRTSENEIKSNLADLNKFAADLKKKEKIATIKTFAPKDPHLFKSDQKYDEFISKLYQLSTQGVSDEDLVEIYQSKLVQVAPLKAASQNRYEAMKSVPNFNFHGASENSSDSKITKSYELMRLLTGGAGR